MIGICDPLLLMASLEKSKIYPEIKGFIGYILLLKLEDVCMFYDFLKILKCHGKVWKKYRTTFKFANVTKIILMNSNKVVFNTKSTSTLQLFFIMSVCCSSLANDQVMNQKNIHMKIIVDILI